MTVPANLYKLDPTVPADDPRIPLLRGRDRLLDRRQKFGTDPASPRPVLRPPTFTDLP